MRPTLCYATHSRSLIVHAENALGTRAISDHASRMSQVIPTPASLRVASSFGCNKLASRPSPGSEGAKRRDGSHLASTLLASLREQTTPIARRLSKVDRGTGRACADSGGSFRRWRGRDASERGLPRSERRRRGRRAASGRRTRGAARPRLRSPRRPAASAHVLTSRTTCLSVSRSPETPPFLRAIGRKRGPWLMRPSRSQVSRRATGQVSGREPRPISTSRQPVLPRMVRSAPFGEEFDPAGAVFGLAGPAIEADDFGAAQAAGEADRQDRPVAQAAQIHLQRRQHGQKLVGEDRGFLQGRAAVAAADAGDLGDARLGAASQAPRERATSAKTPEHQAFPPPAPIPAWARASGRAGEGEPLFAAGAGLALLDACLRPDPPAAGALRSRLALQSAAASAKILRLNTDAAALRDFRFASATRSDLRRTCCRSGATSPGGHPASTQAGFATRRRGSTWPCGPQRPRSRPEGLRRGGRPGFGGRKGRRPGLLRPPGRPAGRSRNFGALGVRHRPRHPAALAAARAADRRRKSWIPTLRSPGAGRRPRPGDPAWPNAAAGAIALAAASALDLAADLSRRSEHPDRRRAQTPRQTGPKSSTSCSPKIASRPPKPPATRR